MQYSFVKSLLESTWMINPSAASVYFPLFKGALSGLQFVKEPEPEDSIPYLVSLASKGVVPFSSPRDLTYAEDGDEFIYVMNLRGVALKHDAMCGPVGTRTQAARLLAMDKNKSVIGHIMVTESGGGQASAVPELADAIQSLTKPIVAWVDGISASAAYYINSYCTHIMASRDSDQIGCIGTMIQMRGLPKFSKLENGEITARIYADEATEKNDEYETALEGNFTLVKERILNPLNEQFKSDVKTNRSSVLDEQLKGRMFRAGDVIGSLIDSVGTFNDAVDLVTSLARRVEKPATKNNTNTNNIQKMEDLVNLNAIESVAGFETADGHASFNEAQLTDIDSQLAIGAEAISRVTVLEGENTTLSDTVAQRDARIVELETALASALGDDSADPALVVKTTDGKITPKKDNSLASAFQACENHLKQFS